MKILLIHSSYRTNGNTARVLQIYEENLLQLSTERNIGIRVETVSLAHSNIQMCRGCRSCFDRGEEKCPLKDDVLLIYQKMLDADAFVIASPVYVEDVNGVMKNWIDRMAFNCHRPAFYGKTALLFSTSAMGSSNHTLRTMHAAMTAWAATIAGRMKFRLGALSDIDHIRSVYKEQIRRESEKLVRSLLDGSAQKPSFYSLLAFAVQKRYWLKNKDYQDTYDYAYWVKQNWLKKECTYYSEKKSGVLRAAFARLTANIISVFLK